MDCNIGGKIRKLRLKRQMTQQEVADMCDLSKGMISKIECGKCMPAIATLTRISHALDVKVSFLMEEDGGNGPVCQSTDVSPEYFKKTEEGYRVYTLAASYTEKQVQPLIFYAKKGEVSSHLVKHQGEECIYIIEGEMFFTVDDVIYHLKKGDFFYFDGRKPHGITSVDDEVRYLNLFADSEYARHTFPGYE